MKNIKLSYSESCSITNCINNMIIDIENNDILTKGFQKELLEYYTNLLRKYEKLENEILKITIKEG